MTERPKLLWHSNAPWAPTGYGAQTALLTPYLKESYEVGISGFYGLEGARLSFRDMIVMPGVGKTYGNETLGRHAERFFGKRRDGLVLTLLDVWVLDPSLIQTMNVCSWVPVDHDPVPPMVDAYFRKSGAIPIAMSRFGEERLAEFDPLYVPHGVDTEAYQPYAQGKARDLAGLPKDAFVVGIVAANKGNPSRKSFPEMLEAFAAFRQRHDDAILYLHTEVTGKYDGINLPVLFGALGIPEESVCFCDQYRLEHDPFSPALMGRIYSSLDVLLNTSRGEGFGLTVLEAQACGVPAITTDFSAMKEVNGSGWQVEWEREWSGQLSFQARPNVEDIFNSLEQAYGLPAAARKQLAVKARAHAETYAAEEVASEYLLPVLERVQDRLAEREPVTLEAVAA